jgi:CRISPR-associated protein Csb2
MLRLTTAVRGALQSLAPQPPREVLSGHTPDGAPSDRPHLAVVPLAFVGPPHADGEVKGFAAVLPRELPGGADDRRHVAHALTGLRRLQLGPCGEWEVERLTPAAAAEAITSLQVGPYVGPARLWATVTPLLLDRFPKDRPGQDAAAVIRRACTRVGLPEPVRVEVNHVSWLRGAPASFQVDYAYKAGLPRRSRTHALLEFDQPVRGPVLLGAGRYIGLGLCRRLARRGGQR